jgi:hypothetical protein
MREKWLFALGIATVVLGTAAAARADSVYLQKQEDQNAREHFYLGAGMTGVRVLAAPDSRAAIQDGVGATITLGARLHRTFALELGWTPTFHGDSDAFQQRVGKVALQAVTLDAKLYPWHTSVQPYLDIGAGAYILGDALGPFAAGPGYQLGGGIDFWLSPWFSLGVKAVYRGTLLLNYDTFGQNYYLGAVAGTAEFAGRF